MLLCYRLREFPLGFRMVMLQGKYITARRVTSIGDENAITVAPNSNGSNVHVGNAASFQTSRNIRTWVVRRGGKHR
jgi:hypothetical protein